MRLTTRVLLLAAVAAVVGMMATAASGASPHFKKNGSPVCTVSGAGTNTSSTTCSASLAGLGQQTLVIEVDRARVGGLPVPEPGRQHSSRAEQAAGRSGNA